MPKVIRSNKEILNEFSVKLRNELPDVYKVYRECMAADKREFGSMMLFAEKIGAHKPVIGRSMREYLNEIWPYIEGYEP